MIRCPDDVKACNTGKKAIERAATWIGPRVPVGFDVLKDLEGDLWLGVQTPAEMREIVDEVRRRLLPEHFPRFSAHIESTYGTAFARWAGLAVGRPRLTLAS